MTADTDLRAELRRFRRRRSINASRKLRSCTSRSARSSSTVPDLPIGTGRSHCARGLHGGRPQWRGLALPTIYQGTGGEHSLYPWTIMMPSDDAIAGMLKAVLDRLAELGVGTVVILSGHFADEQRAMLRDLSRKWQEDGAPEMRLIATTLADRAAPPVAPDHAGRFETVLLAGAHPELVHLDELPRLDAHPSVDPGDDRFGPHRHDPSHPLRGVSARTLEQRDLRSSDLLASTARWIAELATTPDGS